MTETFGGSGLSEPCHSPLRAGWVTPLRHREHAGSCPAQPVTVRTLKAPAKLGAGRGLPASCDEPLAQRVGARPGERQLMLNPYNAS